MSPWLVLFLLAASLDAAVATAANHDCDGCHSSAGPSTVPLAHNGSCSKPVNIYGHRYQTAPYIRSLVNPDLCLNTYDLCTRYGEFRHRAFSATHPGYWEEYRMLCEGLCREKEVETVVVGAKSEDVRCSGARRGQCVKSDELCDGAYDCVDRSDESNCGSTPTKMSSMSLALELMTLGKVGISAALFAGNSSSWPSECNPGQDAGGLMGLLRPCQFQRRNEDKTVRGFSLGEQAPCVDFGMLPNGRPYKAVSAGLIHFDECPALLELIGSDHLWENSTFWGQFPCPVSGWRRCSGNMPGSLCSPERSYLYDRCCMDGDHCNKQVPFVQGRLSGFSILVNTFRSKSRSDNNGCPDMSDKVCSVEKYVHVCQSERFWTCKDNLTCIHKALLCDGYIQCPDESDEDHEMCSFCPRAFGYTKSGDSRLASYSCMHRYTGRAICAIPCNGKDDLCLNNSDEENCVEMIWSVFIGGEFALLFATLALSAALIWLQFKRKSKKIMLDMDRACSTEFLSSLVNSLTQGDKDAQYSLYKQFHSSPGDYLTFYHHLQCTLKTETYETRVKVFQRWLRLEQMAHDKNMLETNYCLKYRMGTNAATKKFYDLTDSGCMGTLLNSTIPRFFKKLCKVALDFLAKFDRCFKIVQLCKKLMTELTASSKWWVCAKMIVVTLAKILICHADIVKDVLLTYAISKVISVNTPHFGQHILGVLAASILATEILNFVMAMAISRKSQMTMPEKVLICLASPLMPATSIAAASWWKLKSELLDCVDAEDVACLVEKRRRFEEEQAKWERLFVTYKVNEMSTEFFVQLLVLVLLVLLPFSQSATVDGLHIIFATSSNIVLVTISISISFVTLIRTLLQRAVSVKNNFLPLFGQALLILSYVVGTLSRFFAVLLYLTPAFGMFSVSMHWKMGKMQFGRNPVYQYVRSKSGDGKYEAKYTKDEWSPTTEYVDYTVWNYEMYMVALLIMSAVHLGLVFMVKRLCNKPFQQRPFSIDKILHVLSNSIVFLPYSEWDDDLDSLGSFAKSWSHTYHESVIMNLLLGVENALLCTPLWILLAKINLREEYLTQYFPPLIEEQLSKERTKLLAFMAPVFFVVVASAVQMVLSHLYYRYGHPWSRIFREEKKKRQNSSQQKRESSESEEQLEEETQLQPEQKNNRTGEKDLGSSKETHMIEYDDTSDKADDNEQNSRMRNKDGVAQDKVGSGAPLDPEMDEKEGLVGTHKALDETEHQPSNKMPEKDSSSTKEEDLENTEETCMAENKKSRNDEADDNEMAETAAVVDDPDVP